VPEYRIDVVERVEKLDETVGRCAGPTGAAV